MAQTIYERLGGEAAIDKAVDVFYAKVLADGRIKHFFDGVDMERQARMQKAFMTYAFGGPNQYAGKTLKAAHAKLVQEKGLSDEHFDAVMENLGATMIELGVDQQLIKEAAALVESARDDVLGRSPD